MSKPIPPDELPRATVEPQDEFPDAPACGTFQPFDETSWKAERARNLREQRRYEIAKDMYVGCMIALKQVGWDIRDIPGSKEIITASLEHADAFLGELAKAVPE